MAPRVAVAVLSLAAGTVDPGPVHADETGPGLRLVWFDPSDVAAASALAARAEAARLFARMGVTVSWRRGEPGEIRRSDEVWVVFLGEGPAAPSAPILGATRKLHSTAPIAWVRVPNVRAAVGAPRSGALLGVDGHRVALALGRVVAHEVVHAVVPTVPHGTGVMAESLGLRRLTAPYIPVDPEAALALRAALRGDPVVAPPEGARARAAVDAEKDR